jgi:sec-independent protein translocase protein TatA
MDFIAFMNIGGQELILILLIVLVLFGAKKLPELARGMGQAIKEFQKAKDEFSDELHSASKPDVAPKAAASTIPTIPGSRTPLATALFGLRRQVRRSSRAASSANAPLLASAASRLTSPGIAGTSRLPYGRPRSPHPHQADARDESDVADHCGRDRR